MPTESPLALNFWDPEFQKDPHLIYRRLREFDPVHRTPVGTIFLTRYKDVQTALKDDVQWPKNLALFANPLPPGPFGSFYERTMLVKEPPDYQRVRGSFQPHFSGASLAHVDSEVRRLAASMLEPLRSTPEFDFMSSFAEVFPVRVMAGVMGLADDDWPLFLKWTRCLTNALDFCATPGDFLLANEAAGEAGAYFTQVLEAEIRNPSRPSLLRALAERITTGRLDLPEGAHNLTLMLLAGSETTASVFGEGMRRLAGDPALLELLQAQPELLPNVTEEFLRLATPFQLTNRYAAGPLELGSHAIDASTCVTLCLAAANRDPEEFANPDMVDPHRPARGNRHVAFGAGTRFCVGAQLARLELAVGFEKILELFPKVRLAAPPQRRPGIVFARFQNIPLVTG